VVNALHFLTETDFKVVNQRWNQYDF